MKRVLKSLFVICLVLSMPSCSATTNGVVSDQRGIGLSMTDSGAPVGNMQKNIPSGNFVPFDNKILFIAADRATGEPRLFSYDSETNSAMPFCKDATCDHKGPSCVSGGVDSNLEGYNGAVYGKSGSVTGKVMKLNNGRFEAVTDSGVAHFFHSGENLYAATADSSLAVFEMGQRKPSVLIEEYAGYWETVCDGYLYYQFEGLNRLNLLEKDASPQNIVENADCITDGEYIYYAKYDDSRLYRCKMDGSEPEQLTDRPVLAASWNFDEEYFYFRYYDGNDIAAGDSCDIYRLLKKSPSQAEKIAELPVPAYQIFTAPDSDTLFVNTWGGSEEIYIISKEVQSVKLLSY